MVPLFKSPGTCGLEGILTRHDPPNCWFPRQGPECKGEHQAKGTGERWVRLAKFCDRGRGSPRWGGVGGGGGGAGGGRARGGVAVRDRTGRAMRGAGWAREMPPPWRL